MYPKKLMSLVILLALTASLSSTIIVGSQNTKSAIVNQGEVLASAARVDVKALHQYIVKFSNFGTRMTGYPGCERAAEYIYEQFSEYGLTDVSFINYALAVPVDKGAKLTILNPGGLPPINVYPMWPNLVAPPQTPPGGLTGDLLYIGDGTLSSLNGKRIPGSIVLMDFNSEQRWIDAAKFGAQAVIFIEPEDTNFREAQYKHLYSVPFNFPRVYIKRADAETLLSLLKRGEKVTVNLQSNMVWERVIARNVIGYVRGITYPEKYILLTSRYDSMSIVPSLAPGAEEAIGISVLLDMAKYYAKNPPKYTLVFIAFSGTDIGVQSSRKFVNETIINNWENWGKKVILQIDYGGINSYLKALAYTVTEGYGYPSQEEAAKWVDVFQRYVFDQLLPEVGKILDMPHTPLGTEQIYNIWRTTFSSSTAAYGLAIWYIWGSPYVCQDHYGLTMIGGPGTGWMTPLTHKKYMFTPLDTPEKVNLENLEYQLKFIYVLNDNFFNLEGLQGKYLPVWTPKLGEKQGNVWSDVHFKVSEYNYTTGWYDPVPNAIVAYSNAYWGIHWWAYEMSDSNGDVRILGEQNSFRIASYRNFIFVIDSETGNVIYAPNYGERRASSLFIGTLAQSDYNIIQWHPQELGIFTVFKAGSLVLFDTVDPDTMNTPYTQDMFLSINDIRTDSPVPEFGSAVYIWPADGKSVAMVYASPGIPLQILLKCTYRLETPFAVMVNKGEGYMIEEFGQQKVIHNTALRIAEDLLSIEEKRMGVLSASGIATAHYPIFVAAKENIQKAQQALNEYRFDEAYSRATAAWSQLSTSLGKTKGTIRDIISSLPFFGVVLIPFAFLFERLVFQSTGKKQLMYILASYLIVLLTVLMTHAGFSLATNGLMVMIGFAILVLLAPVLGIVFSNFALAVKHRSEVVFGRHVRALAETMSRSTAVTISFSVGVGYMRRRAFRTILVVATLIIIVASVSLFSSLGGLEIKYPIRISGTASYDGIMMYTRDWGFLDYGPRGPGGFQGTPTIGRNIPSILETLYREEATVVPIAWLDIGWRDRGSEVWSADCTKVGRFFAIMGIPPEAKDLFPVEAALTPGGRWFMPEDSYTYRCIISKAMAEKLGVSNPGETIGYMGIPFEVVGIVEDKAFDSIKDIHQEPITPLDLRYPGYAQHYMAREIIIMPYDTAVSLGAWTTTVSMKLKDPTLITKIAGEIFERFGSPTYLSMTVTPKEGEPTKAIYAFTKKSVVSFGGIQTQIVPLFMVSFMVLNTMLASVQERKKEISTFSSLGLSPLHVFIVFLTESLVLAVVSAVIGYVVGVVSGRIALEFVPGLLAVNSSSSWVILVVLIMFAVTILSSIYPTITAARLVTPSLERRWRIPTPVGDVWNIPFPLVIETDEEAKGMVNYLAELVKAHMVERPEVFQTLNAKYSERDELTEFVREIQMDISLEPYELGIKTGVRVMGIKDKESMRHRFVVTLERTAGTRDLWITHGRTFVDLIRKQLLFWRSMKPEERESYMKREAEVT